MAECDVKDDRSCNCQGCNQYNPGYVLDSLCKTCRADLELGRLVRKMGLSSVLAREGPNLWNYYENKSDDEQIDRDGDTPEEALKGASK